MSGLPSDWQTKKQMNKVFSLPQTSQGESFNQ